MTRSILDNPTGALPVFVKKAEVYKKFFMHLRAHVNEGHLPNLPPICQDGAAEGVARRHAKEAKKSDNTRARFESLSCVVVVTPFCMVLVGYGCTLSDAVCCTEST